MESLKYKSSKMLGHGMDSTPVGCRDWDLSTPPVSSHVPHHEPHQSEKLFSAALKYLEDKGKRKWDANSFFSECEDNRIFRVIQVAVFFSPPQWTPLEHLSYL
jgi:hypothetical protein